MQNTKNQIWRSPYAIFSLLLWLKLGLLRLFLFKTVDLKWWLVDLASVLVLTSLFELVFPRRMKKGAYWGLNFILSLIFLAATLYFEHFGSVVTYTAIAEIKQLIHISSSVKASLHLEDFLFFADFILVVVMKLIPGIRRFRLMQERAVRRYVVIVLWLNSLGASVYFIRSDNNITNELVRAEQLGLLNYEMSVAFKGMKEDTESKFTSIEQAVLAVSRIQTRFNYGIQPDTSGKPAYFGSQQGRNVIVLQMEAFQNFPIHLNYNNQEVTPVLNKLASESFYFPHVFQQVGQGNTSDAEFMSNTSIYPTGTIPMSTGYGDRILPSMPRLLEERGYEANTFHVNEVHFWDRNKLYPALGFTRYYDKPNYTDDHFNSFGASDEELFRVGVEKLTELQKQNKPFYAQFITVSSHYPFKIPDDRRKMTLPASVEGKQLGDYLLSINYTDYAIGTLIEKLKAAGLWDNTVLIAYGDHFGLQPQDNDTKVLSQELGIPYHEYITRFNIPLIVHIPGQTQGQTIDRVGGQLDIMPTLANLMGISLDDENFIHFGQDLLNIQKNAFGMRYYLPTGSFFNDDILFVPGKGFDDGTAVSIRSLQPVTDLTPFRKDYNYIMRLMSMSDEYVKLLPKRE
ncbi:LTA synthase family protein [Paenibacillus rigui]|uniref:Sulfatase n=1 Tax=Paenibacillus rigui TaxID=554312 RepID=A0A229UPN2_9BACL|nr:LTA synthase family protein [Paenibacillus rigui]OXM85320.1 sulfatase [Paenibacillus rigui]